MPEGLQIDGRLDEPIYREVLPASDFYQMEPNPGAPATEKTDLWIAYDADHVYVTVRCWDSQPEHRWVLNEMRRDSGNISRNENIAFILDTFHDRRNSAVFEVTPLGGIWDGLVTNERPMGADWNPVWVRQAGRFEGGWTVEVAIPFQVAPLPRGQCADVGVQPPSHRSLEERGIVLAEDAARGRRVGVRGPVSGVECSDGSRHSGAVGQQQRGESSRTRSRASPRIVWRVPGG